MSLKEAAQAQDSTKDGVNQLRNELQLMMEKQASMMHTMREMMAEFMRNNGRSESGSAEGYCAVGGSPRGLNPLLHEKPLLLLLLLLEAGCEEIRQQEGRRFCVRVPRVISE